MILAYNLANDPAYKLAYDLSIDIL